MVILRHWAGEKKGRYNTRCVHMCCICTNIIFMIFLTSFFISIYLIVLFELQALMPMSYEFCFCCIYLYLLMLCF